MKELLLDIFKIKTAVRAFFLSLICVSVLGLSCLSAQDITVMAFFDKKTVDVDDEIKYTIKIVGDVGSMARPQLPAIDDFDVYYISRSTNFAFIGGKSVPEVQYSFVFVPQEVGTYRIPAFDIQANNMIFKTDETVLSVVSLSGSKKRSKPYRHPHVPSSTNIPFSKNSPVQNHETLPQRPAPLTKGADKNLFVMTTVDKDTVYPNEQITLTYTLLTRVDLQYQGFDQEPDFKGFWIEELTDEKNLVRDETYFEGQRYLRADVRKIALFPTEPGTYALDLGTLKAQVQKVAAPNDAVDSFFDDDFFGQSVLSKREERILTTTPVSVTVLDFPLENRPEHFKGASGDFRISGYVDNTQIKINTPLVLTIVIEGKGNVETIQTPVISGPLNDFSLFETKTSVEKSKVNEQMRGKKTFQYTFLPTRAGELIVPEVFFAFFHLKYQKYMTLSRGPFSISVAAGRSDSSDQELSKKQIIPDELKDTIRTETLDIQYLKQTFRDDHARSIRIRNFLFLIDAGLLAALIIIAMRKRREKIFASNASLRRKEYAYESFRRQYKEIQKERKNTDPRFFERAALVLDHYFADKFDLSPYGLTWDVIKSQLESVEISSDVIAQCDTFYETCNMARFTSAQLSRNDYEEIDALLKTIGAKLEKLL
jgi:hypothetical protein